MELAIPVDVGEVFVKATYNLEGDGPLALSTYEHILSFLFFNYNTLSQYCCNLHINCLVLIKDFIGNCMITLYHVQNQHIFSVEGLLGS